MRVVPSTRTKDDANKELHEIELKINREKGILESIAKQRAEAEAGFAAREQKCKDAEIESRKNCNELVEVVSAKEKEIKHIDNHIASKTSAIGSLKNDEKVAVESFKIEKKHREKILKDLSDSIEMLEKDMLNLDRNATEKNNKIEELRAELHSLEEKRDEVIKETTATHTELDEKRSILDNREIALEHKLSNFRTLSVRLHQKYKDKLSQFEITQTTI